MAHDEPGPTAQALIQKIIERRTEQLVGRSLEATSVLAFLYHDSRPIPEEEHTRRHREATAGNRRRIIRQRLYIKLQEAIRAIVNDYPSVTRKELLAFIRESFPSSRGKGASEPFDSNLVGAAHDALMKDKAWDCRAACDALADRLAVSRRTIETLRRSYRRKTLPQVRRKN